MNPNATNPEIQIQLDAEALCIQRKTPVDGLLAFFIAAGSIDEAVKLFAEAYERPPFEQEVAELCRRCVG